MAVHRSINPPASFGGFPKEEIEQSLAARFAAQAERFAEHPAVVTRGEATAYAELDLISTRVAQTLIAASYDRQTPVVLWLEPGCALVGAILGVLKAGGFFLPLDPHAPPAYNAVIYEHARARTLLVDSTHLDAAIAVAGSGAQVINIESIALGASPSLPLESIDPGSPACVLYLSSPTGRPKGVVHSHRSVLHAIYQQTNSLRLCRDDRFAQIASCSRLAGMLPLWRALLNGATLHVFDLSAEGSDALPRWLAAERITVYQSGPQLFRHWVRSMSESSRLPHLRLLHLGGGALTPEDIALYRKHFSDETVLLHDLATTEAFTCCEQLIFKDSAFPGSAIPAGTPVEDKEITLVDDNGDPVGSGEAGEIAVTSRYLALGYWEAQDLAEATFQIDPHDRNLRTYRTGDIGLRGSDRSIELLGRNDRQLRIRGLRVEPLEIEATLEQEPTIHQALVLAQEESSGTDHLIAYLVPAAGCTPSVRALQTFLRERLPEQMIPRAFIVLESFPQDSEGRIDLENLPPPGPLERNPEVPFVAPGTEIQRIVATVWEDVLRLQGIGLQDRFLEMGGDSLKAMEVISRLQSTLGGILPFARMCRTATVEQQAQAIEEYLNTEDLGEETAARVERTSQPSPNEFTSPPASPQAAVNQTQSAGPADPSFELRSAIPGSDLQLELMIRIIRAWNPRPGTAIDLGCRDGLLGRILLDHFPECHVTFIDFSELMLELAHEKVASDRNARVIKADFTHPEWTQDLPFTSCDLMISNIAIHHLQDPRKKALFAEIYQLLRPGGVFLNLDQVRSPSGPVARLYAEHLIDALHQIRRRTNPFVLREEVAESYYSSPARQRNILAPVDTQCQWLREAGFVDVDCYFKVFEHALFGGRKAGKV